MKKDGNATSGGGEVKYGVRCKVFLIDLLSVQVFFCFFLTNMVVFLRFSIHFFFISHLMITMAACDSLFVFLRFSKHSKFRPIL